METFFKTQQSRLLRKLSYGTTRQIAKEDGFTLIELLIVIILTTILIIFLLNVIDPLDKIAAANDSGVITDIAQIGRAEESYATLNAGHYVAAGASATDLATPLAELNSGGEIKFSSYTPPQGYVVNYLAAPVSCATGVTCTDYAWIITNLQSKKYASNPVFQVVDGKSCFVATPITQAELDNGYGPGFCP